MLFTELWSRIAPWSPQCLCCQDRSPWESSVYNLHRPPEPSWSWSENDKNEEISSAKGTGTKWYLGAELSWLKVLNNLLVLLHRGQIDKASQLLKIWGSTPPKLIMIYNLETVKKSFLPPEWNPSQRPPSPPRCRGSVEPLVQSSPPVDEAFRFHFQQTNFDIFQFNDKVVSRAFNYIALWDRNYAPTFIILPWGGAWPPWFRSWTCPRARHSCASLNAGQCRSPSRTTPASAQSSPEEEAFQKSSSL